MNKLFSVILVRYNVDQNSFASEIAPCKNIAKFYIKFSHPNVDWTV